MLEICFDRCDDDACFNRHQIDPCDRDPHPRIDHDASVEDAIKNITITDGTCFLTAGHLMYTVRAGLAARNRSGPQPAESLAEQDDDQSPCRPFFWRFDLCGMLKT